MPNWKKVITSGSDASLNTLNLSGVVNANTDTDKFLVLDSSGNVDFRTGANVLSDIGGASSSTLTTISSSFSTRITTLETQAVTPVQTYVDFKGLNQGGLPWGGTTDLMPIDRWMGVWIAPKNGYIEKIYVSPENANPTTGNFDITLYKNAIGGNTETQAMGSPGSNVQFTFGSTNYSFSANDRIYLDLNKNTNSCDFYAVQVVFRLNN